MGATRVMRRQDWGFYASLVGIAGAAVAGLRWPAVTLLCVVLAVAATWAAKVASRRHPEPMPYAHRWTLALTRPFFPSWALRRALDPQPGQRILELGPGTGRHAVAMARAVAPCGRIDVLDIQPAMVGAVAARASRRGAANVDATVGDAHHLPWPDATFDAAYLVTVLGEIPDQEAALHELARVVRPGGRVVVGELIGDPHWVSPGALERRAAEAGLRLERRIGSPLGYFAVLRTGAGP